MFKTALPIALLLGFTGAAQAAQTLYECAINYDNVASKKPEVNLIIVRLDGTKDAMAIDGMIAGANQNAPLPIKVVTENAKRTTFAWTDKNFKHDDHETISWRARATWRPATQKMSISYKPLGPWDGGAVLNGTCKVTRKK